MRVNDVYIHFIGRRDEPGAARTQTQRTCNRHPGDFPMKTILASILALGLFAGAASASTVTPTQADTSVTGYCAPYYGD